LRVCRRGTNSGKLGDVAPHRGVGHRGHSPAALAKSNMIKTEIRIIYGDTDQMGVVYYGNYLRFFEAARNEWLRAKGARWREIEAAHSIYLPVVEAKVNYKRPAFYDDLVEIEARLADLGRASLRFDYRVLRGAELLALGHTVHACVSRDGDMQEFPEPLLDRLRAGK
jgi:acyl-CoA thioester hydrolase